MGEHTRDISGGGGGGAISECSDAIGWFSAAGGENWFLISVVEDLDVTPPGAIKKSERNYPLSYTLIPEDEKSGSEEF